jgi:hypothetical protein
LAVSHAKSNTVADWTGTVTVGNSTGGTQTIAATNLVRPADWNSAHNQFYTLSGNTNNASTASGTNVVFQGMGAVTLVGSTGTIGISVAPALDGTVSFYQNVPFINNTATLSVGGGSSNWVFPFQVPNAGSFSYLRMPVSMSLASTTFTTGAAGYGSSVAQSNSFWFNIYTVGSGASSQSLQWLTSASTTWAFQISYSGTSSSHSVSYNVTFPNTGGVSGTTQMTSSQASASINEVPAGTSNFQSFRYFDMAFATSLSAGNYYAAIQRSSTTGGGSNIGLGISQLIVTQHNSSIGVPNQASSSSNHLMPYLGSWSTNTLGRTTSSIARSQVSTAASHPMPIFQMIREA